MSGAKWKPSEEDAKPPKVALTTSNHLCENLDLRAIRDRPEFFSLNFSLDKEVL